ncbi:caspase-3-like isoform X2 [Phlebotomus argentipes]|uniref:caspase-3-like isoform X2 n=1 Tax=Phlebotomus argentipes TaxID=94469 RepID=UPI0028935462|nr:caspase-3-like isoform X2 [Phlebotomus argentipes]
MPLGNSRPRQDMQRSFSFNPPTMLSTSSSHSTGSATRNFSATKISSSSSSSTYHSYSSSTLNRGDVFKRAWNDRSSINKPDNSPILKDHLTIDQSFTNMEKEILKQPFKTTLNAPLGTYSSNTTTWRNSPSLTGATFSDAVKAQPMKTSALSSTKPALLLTNIPIGLEKKSINNPVSNPVRKPVTPETPTKASSVYDISKKGFALIFNNEKFDQDHQAFRTGSRNDENELKKTLGRFNIDVKVERDANLNTIEKKVKEISKMDFKKKSCLIVCVLSHGNEGQTIFARDRSYNLDKDIIEPIIRNATLAGKPKIFIVQACKGSVQSVGYVMTDSTQVKTSLTKPSEADILILYSSYEGRVSYRMDVGSIFIQKLCTFINSNHRTDSLEDIMKKTRRDITDHAQINKIFKQTPTMVSTLTKDFFFTV